MTRPYTSRPKRKGSAQAAWDFFSCKRGEPKEMGYCWLDFWVWWACWDDGDSDEIAAAEIKKDWKGYR